MEEQWHIAVFLETTLATIERGANPGRIVLGIDESLNCSEVQTLASSLVGRRLVDMSVPLWYETRIRQDGTMITYLGGLSKDSPLRTDPVERELIGDVGKPLRHRSFDDTKVVQCLVANFCSRDQLVLLTANIRWNHGGLRQILNTQVKPWLSREENDQFSLVVLFKRGKTPMGRYCSGIEDFFRLGTINYGYREILI